jgi:hypothetical protein
MILQSFFRGKKKKYGVNQQALGLIRDRLRKPLIPKGQGQA